MGFRKMKPDYDVKDMIDTPNNEEDKKKIEENFDDADIELTDEDIESLNNPDNLLNEVKKDLLKTKKYIDKKIFEAEIKSKGYDKFSQSIFLTKLELAKEKRQVLETLAKIAFEEKKYDSNISDVESITDLLNK